jgi:RES domain
VIDQPGEHPNPHSELPTQSPLIFEIPVGGILYRHHQKVHDPIYFGKKGDYRFDDPNHTDPDAFGVLYAGADPECCLLESCGSTTGVPAVSGAYLEKREIATLELTESLCFIDLAGDGGLASIGADNRLTTGSYRVSQLWSAALRKHPCQPDGIRYRSRHAPERIAYAIYERSPSSFNRTSMGSFTDPSNAALFKFVLKTYSFALI